MIITREHAQTLERLLADQEARRAHTTIETSQEPLLQELEVQGLARQDKPLHWTPTYWGARIDEALRRARRHGLAEPTDWKEGWRWLGSDIVTLLKAADRAGKIGPIGAEPLQERGLAARQHDPERKIDTLSLTEAGQAVLDAYRALEPALTINGALAERIRYLPTGPAESARLSTPGHEEHLLEGMRLIAYSAPGSDIFSFTMLGQAVKKTLELGGFGSTEMVVLSETILRLLAAHSAGDEVDDDARFELQSLAYLDDEGNLLPAGEWALEVYRLWLDGKDLPIWGFSIEQEEAEVLKAVADLTEKMALNPEAAPTFANLRREMIDRKVKQYKALLARYGRKLDEMPEKYRQIAARFADAKDLQRWYDDNFELREALYSLESFDLLRTLEDEKGREYFAPTETGREVLDDQEIHQRDISATAVKVVSLPRRTFDAPNMDWWREARDQHLIGSQAPTRSGLMYARLACRGERWPHLSRYEMMVFHHIPERGVSLEDIYAELENRLPRERIRWALEKLEARHLIDVLPDGNVVESPIGALLDRALAGVPEGFGNPINPVIVRLLKALADVGTLYVKERKIRVLPRQWKEAIRRSGLPRETFDNALEMARAAGLVGRANINEAGLLVLEALERMQPQADLGLPGESAL